MSLAIKRAQPLQRDVRVDLGAAQIGMPKQLLHGAQVGAASQQVSGKAVPESVR